LSENCRKEQEEVPVDQRRTQELLEKLGGVGLVAVVLSNGLSLGLTRLSLKTNAL
jgi:hypothetical protein